VTSRNNAVYLERWRAQRRMKSLSDVGTLLDRLEGSGETVTFARVAREAGVSRSWLYESGFADRIRQLRDSGQGSARASHGRPVASESSIRARLNDALDDNRRLRHENRELRDQLELALGAQRLRSV
jgi:hypothetical protein